MSTPETSDADSVGGKTVLQPGGTQSPESAPATHRDPAPEAGGGETAGVAGEIRFAGIGINPLTDAAAHLFVLAGQIRGSTDAPRIELLRNQLISELKAFEATALARQVDFGAVIPARYALCSLLDELVLTTPWGGASTWNRQTLLSLFHNETWGGEKFFQMIARAVRNPPKNLILLELLYLCLAHGFAGRYRVVPDGKPQLELVRDNLYQVIRSQRETPPNELSPHWKPFPVQRKPLRTLLPMWQFAAVAVIGLAVLYAVFDFKLHREAAPIFEQLDYVGKAPPTPAERFGTLQLSPPPATDILKPDVDAGRLELIKQPGFLLIRVTVSDLFASARTQVTQSNIPLFGRIAEYLEKVPGKVQVTGYTDNLPIRSKRFPSNEALSEARAKAVGALLRQKGVAAERLTAVGRGAADPVAPNDTPANRARNRRVEIVIDQRARATGHNEGGRR